MHCQRLLLSSMRRSHMLIIVVGDMHACIYTSRHVRIQRSSNSSWHLCTCVLMRAKCTCGKHAQIHKHVCVSIYIYTRIQKFCLSIYIHRKISVCLYTYIEKFLCVYIYTYIEKFCLSIYMHRKMHVVQRTLSKGTSLELCVWSRSYTYTHKHGFPQHTRTNILVAYMYM